MGSMPVESTPQIDLAGLVPAPITPFNIDGSIDYAAIQRLGSWLGSIPGVKGLVVLGHAGEGTFPHPRRAGRRDQGLREVR